MPLYKYVGNRILTTFQNKLTGLELSEWHSGYRAYRVDALADLDLGVVLRRLRLRHRDHPRAARRRRRRIVEVPIPTYYGDEICYVNGLKYAKDVTVDVAALTARRMGFGGRPSACGVDTEAYELKPSPHSSHGGAARAGRRARAGRESSTSAAPTDSSAHLVRRARAPGRPASTWSSTRASAERLDDFVEADLNQRPAPDACTDVRRGRRRRHPRARRRPRDRCSRTSATASRPGGEILVSVPNFGHWYPRGTVALGRFDYDQRGPLDHGHVRFFTRRSFERLVDACGLRIVERDRRLAVRRARPRWLARARALAHGGPPTGRATRAWPTLFGYQFLYRLERG